MPILLRASCLFLAATSGAACASSTQGVADAQLPADAAGDAQFPADAARDAAPPDATPADDGAHSTPPPPFAPCATLGFGSAHAIAVSPDGSLVAVGSWLDEVRVYRTSDGSVAQRLPTTATVNSVAFSPDGQRLAAAVDDGSVALWRVATGALEHTVQHLETTGWRAALSVAFSPDGATLASVGGHAAQLWSVVDGSLVRSMNTVTDPYLAAGAAAFSPDGALLAAGGLVFRVADGSVALRLGDDGAGAVAFSPDGAYLAAIGSGHTLLREWRLADGALVAQRTGGVDADYFTAIAFRPDGGGLALANDGQLEFDGVLDASAPLPQPLGLVRSSAATAREQVQFSADGSTFVAATGSRIAVFNATPWAIGSDTPRLTIEGSASSQAFLALAPDGRRAYTVALAGSTALVAWDVAAGTTAYRLDGVGAAALSPDGRTLATSAGEQEAPAPGLALRRASDGTATLAFASQASVTALAFSPDGREVAGATREGTIVRWSAQDGHPLGTLRAPAATVRQLVYSPDGAQLVSASSGQDVAVLRIADGTTVFSRRPAVPSVGLAYSADGTQGVVGASTELGVDVLRVSDWSTLATLPPFGIPHGLAVDPRSGAIAVVTHGETRLLRPDGSVVQSFGAPPESSGTAGPVAFSADGARLGLTDLNGVLRVYCR